MIVGHHDILNTPQQRLTSRKPLWCDMTPTDIKSHWRESWKSAPVVNAHLVDDPTIRQTAFTLPRQQWSLLNWYGQGTAVPVERLGALQTDLCPYGETQMMSHIVESCPYQAERWSVSLCCHCCYCLADQLWILIAYTRKRRTSKES